MKGDISKKTFTCSDGHGEVKWTYDGNKKNIPQCPICFRPIQ